MIQESNFNAAQNILNLELDRLEAIPRSPRFWTKEPLIAFDFTAAIGTDRTNPSTCLYLSDNNNSSDYQLVNSVGGTFNLSPCNVDVVNSGTLSTSGTITLVQSCPDASPCPP